MLVNTDHFSKFRPAIRYYGSISESRYKDAEAAKKSIAEFGYYLTGGEHAFTTALGRQMK
jgi:hypothetical protein